MVVGVVLALAACGRPTGDFGRAKPSVLHDVLLPKAGTVFATQRGEPVSSFNMTDDEHELRDRAWAFVRAPHVKDWWFDTLAEGERTRILPALEGSGGPSEAVAAMFPEIALPLLAPAYDVTRYYSFLRSDDFQSSEARWTRLNTDMTGDALLVEPYCRVAARVRKTDAERLAVVGRQPSIDPAFGNEAIDRVEENEAVNAWVWRALRLRLTSYRVAIDRLQVETPSAQLWETSRTFSALAAQRCEGGPALRLLPSTKVPRMSRLLKGPDPFDEPVLQK